MLDPPTLPFDIPTLSDDDEVATFKIWELSAP